MKFKFVSLLFIVFCAMNSAIAGCDHYQVDELKKMSANRLGLEYCMNTAGMKYLETERKLAYDRISLEGRRGSQKNLGELKKAEDDGRQFGQQLSACQNDTELIKRLFDKKTNYKKDISAGCQAN